MHVIKTYYNSLTFLVIYVYKYVKGDALCACEGLFYTLELLLNAIYIYVLKKEYY